MAHLSPIYAPHFHQDLSANPISTYDPNAFIMPTRRVLLHPNARNTWYNLGSLQQFSQEVQQEEEYRRFQTACYTGDYPESPPDSPIEQVQWRRRRRRRQPSRPRRPARPARSARGRGTGLVWTAILGFVKRICLGVLSLVAGFSALLASAASRPLPPLRSMMHLELPRWNFAPQWLAPLCVVLWFLLALLRKRDADDTGPVYVLVPRFQLRSGPWSVPLIEG